MFVHFADILDKRIENVIEKKMVKVEKKEKKEKKEEEKDETEDLIGNEVQNFEFFFSKKSGLLEQSGILWSITVVKYGINF